LGFEAISPRPIVAQPTVFRFATLYGLDRTRKSTEGQATLVTPMIRSKFRPKIPVLALAFLSVTFFVGCAGGGGVDVPNSIHPSLQGVVTGDSGCRADRSEIRIRPAGWNAVEGSSQAAWNTTTSSLGAFSLPAPDSGDWILEARDTLGDCGTLASFASTEIVKLSGNQPLAVRLRKTADIGGTVVAAAETDPTRWSIAVPGLDRTTVPDSQGNWSLASVPAGTLAPVAIATSSTVHAVIPLASVTLPPGGQILLPPVVVGSIDSSSNRSVSGKVLTENGIPAPGATVSIAPIDPGASASSTRTDDSGRFAILLPNSGTWIVSANTADETISDTLRPADLATSALTATRARLDTLRMTTRPVPRLVIDDWEPREDAIAVPSFVRQGPTSLDQVWMGYSDGRLYVSESTGRTAAPSWIRLDSASDGHGGIVDVAPGSAVTAIAAEYSNDGYSAYVAFAGSEPTGKFWKVSSTSNGLTWTDLSSRLPAGDIQYVEISGWTSVVYVLAAGRIWNSLDGGATFSTSFVYNEKYQPPVDTLTSTVSAFNRNARKDQLVAGTIDGQIWTARPVTPPNNPTWTKISGDAGSPLPSTIVTSIAFDDRDTSGKTIYASFGNAASEPLWVTRDGGQNWSSLRKPSTSANLEVGGVSVALAPGATTLYCSTNAGTFRSDDNGATWTNKPRKAMPGTP